MKINRRCKKSLHKNKKFNVIQIKISKQLAHEVITKISRDPWAKTAAKVQ